MVVPVSDVDRAKAFYADQVGFKVDLDHKLNDRFRVVQLTPPGSASSISVGVGITDAPPGSVRGLQLVVSDIEGAHAQLVERGVDVSKVQHFDNGAWVDGKGGPWNSFIFFIFFKDPDGNRWAVQESPRRG